MAKITKKSAHDDAQQTNAPYGSATTLHYALATNAVGAVVGGDVATGIAAADVVRFGVLPAGMRLDNALIAVSVGMTATVTGKLGFAYVDGVDSAEVPQDDDYFGAGITVAVAGRYPASNVTVRPVTLPKDAYLTLTTAVAANAKASQIDVLVNVTAVGIA